MEVICAANGFQSPCDSPLYSNANVPTNLLLVDTNGWITFAIKYAGILPAGSCQLNVTSVPAEPLLRSI